MPNTTFQPEIETRFVGTAPHPSGKCPSCRRKTRHFYRYADAQTKLCIRCIEAGLQIMKGSK